MRDLMGIKELNNWNAFEEVEKLQEVKGYRSLLEGAGKRGYERREMSKELVQTSAVRRRCQPKRRSRARKSGCGIQRK